MIDAQRVPPSACSTSQSTRIVRSPSAARSTTARSDRPIRRWISCVRPDCLPSAASRRIRVFVERGNIPYSAVSQPCPLPFRNSGTPSSTLAVQTTRVWPASISTEPSACVVYRLTMRSGRNSSLRRPPARPFMRRSGRSARDPRSQHLREIRELDAVQVRHDPIRHARSGPVNQVAALERDLLQSVRCSRRRPFVDVNYMLATLYTSAATAPLAISALFALRA